MITQSTEEETKILVYRYLAALYRTYTRINSIFPDHVLRTWRDLESNIQWLLDKDIIFAGYIDCHEGSFKAHIWLFKSTNKYILDLDVIVRGIGKGNRLRLNER